MRKGYRTVKPRFWVILSAVLLVAGIFLYAAQQRYIDRQQAMLEELRAQKAALVEENEALQRKIDFSYTDEFIEREARSKLGLVREDEILFETN